MLKLGDGMKEEFRNWLGNYCEFTEDSIITAIEPFKKATVFPYGSIENINTFLGITIKSYSGDGFAFGFSNMNKATKKRIKKLCKNILKNKYKYSRTPSYEIEIDEEEKERIRSISQPPVYTKYGSLKIRAIIISAIIFIIIALIMIFGNGSADNKKDDKGHWGDDGYYNPTDQEMQDAWDDANDWMEENW